MGDGKPIPKDVPKNVKCTIELPVLEVFVRSAFYVASKGECFSPGEGVTGVTFELDGKPIGTKTTYYGTSGRISSGVAMKVKLAAGAPASKEVGWTKLPLTGVADGDYTLKVIPPASQASSAPADASLKDGAKRMWRPLHIKITLKDAKLTAAATCDPDDGTKKINHGAVGAFDGISLAIDMKPDWVRSEYGPRSRSKAASLILVHHTGKKLIGTSVHEAINSKGPHYEIDTDGHVVKFVEDTRVASHAGTSKWGGEEKCNALSIGIEIVNEDAQDITEEQYASLITLLKGLVTDLGIKPHRIIGHADCRTHDKPGDTDLLSSDRADCPGFKFEWERLEKEGLGMIPKAGESLAATDWGGYFASHTDPLRKGDNDEKHVYGGKKRDEISGTIEGLQKDLETIGYSVKVNGTFDAYTEAAADRFKRHFFSGASAKEAGLTTQLDGKITKLVADKIKMVVAGLPAAAKTAL